MTAQEVTKRSRELSLEKATLIRDQAKRQYDRCVDLERSMAGAIAAVDIEAAKLALDLAEISVMQRELRLAREGE